MKKGVKSMINKTQTKTTTNFNEPLPTLGDRLQKINPQTLELVQVYESVSECMRENEQIKRPSLNKAITENTVYCGFRWLLVDRELDPHILHNSIKPTKITRIQQLGYIAKLNSDQTKILAIYLDRKTASLKNEYPSESSLDTVVRNKVLSKNNYYVLYDECSTALKNEFNVSTPVLYKDGIGKFNENNDLIKEYKCKFDCIQKDSISEKTLKRALQENKMYNGFYYKMLGEKLFC